MHRFSPLFHFYGILTENILKTWQKKILLFIGRKSILPLKKDLCFTQGLTYLKKKKNNFTSHVPSWHLPASYP